MSEEFLPATDDQDATPAPPDPSSMGTPTSVPATATDPTASAVDATNPVGTQTAGSVDADTAVTVTQPVPAGDLPGHVDVIPASADPATTEATPASSLPATWSVLPAGPVRAGDLPPDTLVVVYDQTAAAGVPPATPDSTPAAAPAAVPSSPTVPTITEPVASAPTVDTSTSGVSVNDPVALAYGPNTNVKEVQVELGQTLQHIADQAKVAAIQIYQANAPEIERVARDELGLVVSFAGRYLKAGTKLLVPDRGDEEGR